MVQATLSELAASLLQEDVTAHANSVPVLLAELQEQPHNDSELHLAVKALRHFFEQAYDRGHAAKAVKASQGGTAIGTYQAWLQRQHQVHIQVLLSVLDGRHAHELQLDAVVGLMEAVRGPNLGHFDTQTFSNLLIMLLTSAHVKPRVLGSFLSKFLDMRDVQYYALLAVQLYCSKQGTRGTQQGLQKGQKVGLAASQKQSDNNFPVVQKALAGDDVLRNVYDALMAVHDAAAAAEDEEVQEGAEAGSAELQKSASPPTYKTWTGALEAGVAFVPVNALQTKDRKKRRKLSQQDKAAEDARKKGQQVAAPWASESQFRKAYGNAWLAFLQQRLPEDVLRKVLLHAPEALLPRMHNPLLLSDFLASAIQQGGLLGILALNSIFLLVTKHGLEYPKFYDQLYNLLTPQAFKAAYRSRFFALVDVFLSSGMVPAYTAAAFAKRMARRALQAPPGGACIAVAFVHNILRRHPACAVLLHKPCAQGTEAELVSADVYADSAQDPAESRAIESSLWEIDALKQHYSTHVTSLVSSLNKDFSDRKKVAEMDLEPLLHANYLSMSDAEIKRKTRTGVSVEYHAEPVEHLFKGCEFPGWKLV